MKKIIAIAFKYSCLYLVVYAIKSVYLMLTFEPGTDRFLSPYLTAETAILFYSIPLAFIICLALSHRNYLKQTARHSFKDILVLSVLFLFITYCMTYAAGYLEHLLFYKKQYAAQEQTGLLGLLNTFSQPGAQPPRFTPPTHLFVVPAQSAYELLRRESYWGFLHEIFISRPGMILTVLHFEGLYLLFKKYQEEKWFYILPVINKWKLVQIAQKPTWYFFALLIPVVRIVVLYMIHVKIAGHFKKSKLFALGLTLLAPFYYGALGVNTEMPDNLPED